MFYLNTKLNAIQTNYLHASLLNASRAVRVSWTEGSRVSKKVAMTVVIETFGDFYYIIKILSACSDAHKKRSAHFELFIITAEKT